MHVCVSVCASVCIAPLSSEATHISPLPWTKTHLCTVSWSQWCVYWGGRVWGGLTLLFCSDRPHLLCPGSSAPLWSVPPLCHAQRRANPHGPHIVVYRLYSLTVANHNYWNGNINLNILIQMNESVKSDISSKRAKTIWDNKHFLWEFMTVNAVCVCVYVESGLQQNSSYVSSKLKSEPTWWCIIK